MNALYLTLAYFLIYSFLGWCCEVIYCTLNSGTFVNRGFLNGPYCPIYGFGMVGILALLEPVFDNMPLLFLGATLITSSIELAGGWILYKLFHARWWDYSKKPFNLGGYICAEFSLIWGLATLGVIKFLHPVVTLLVTRMIPDFLKWPFVILGCLITNLLSPYGPIDMVVGTLATAVAAFLTMKMPRWYLAGLPPIVMNALLLPPMWAWATTGAVNGAFWAAYGLNLWTFVVGEAVACYVLGTVLLRALPKVKYFRPMIPAARLS